MSAKFEEKSCKIKETIKKIVGGFLLGGGGPVYQTTYLRQFFQTFEIF